MKWKYFTIILVILAFLFITVLYKKSIFKQEYFSLSKNSDTLQINLQPFNDVPPALTNELFDQLKEIYPKIRLKKPIEIPDFAYYPPRNRYLADSIINYLKRITPKDEKCISLTTKDISHRNGKITNYGIMGLGFQPGRSCVISSFRLSKKNSKQQLYKLALHEMGHNFGLPHCNNLQCIMRDAKGKNHFDELPAFCESCKKHLTNQGWNL